MKRVVPLIAFGALALLNGPVFSAPIGAYYQVMQAVYARDEAGLKYLISVGLNVNATNVQGKTALCTTVENQDYEGYELLLSQGATTRTPCMRNMNPQVLARFQAEQPPLGTYYEGAVLTASRNGAFSGVGKEVSSTIAGLPYPHVGEILLAGVAAGAAFAIGVHGSGGGDNPDPPLPSLNYESPFTDQDPTATNYLIADYFSNPTNETQLAATNPSDTSKSFADYKNEYNSVNTTEITWKNQAGDEIFPQNFLKQINAANAYARGYTGYAVNRNADGSPTTTGWDAINTDKPIKVAVMDNGLFWNEDLRDGIDLTGSLFKKITYGSGTSAVDYYQSVGKSYVYGTKESENNPYWVYNGTTKVASLMEKYGSTTVLDTHTFEDDEEMDADHHWYRYAGKFAPVCDSITSGSTSCLKKTDEEEIPHTTVKRYTISYLPNKSSATTDAMATYYMYDYLWDQYVAAYGASGYEFTSTDATGNFFQKTVNDSIDHGTHVTGIISALRNGSVMQGVAYNAEVIPVKLDLDVGQTVQHIPDVINTYSGLRIMNLSIGPSTDKPKYYISNDPSKNEKSWEESGLSEYYSSALPTGSHDGTAFVFAAGNGDSDNNGLPQSSIFSVAPLVDSAYKNLLINVVSLGNLGQIADYSNRCGSTASYCLAAPGGNISEGYGIMSTGLSILGESSYDMKQGTSMAAPVVSGSLAVLMGAFPFLTTKQAVEILLNSAQYITPTEDEITAYNNLQPEGWEKSVYKEETDSSGKKYNSIYGRGLVALNAATDPVGLPKITFSTKATSTSSVTAASSSAYVSSTVANTLKALPKNLIVLDDYTRAYQMPTRRFVRSEKRSDNFRRSFRSFMAHDEKEVATSDTLSFAFSKAPADKKNLQTGSMSMMMRPNKNIHMRLGFTEDTASFGGSYVDRSLQNPFMNMRQAFGADLGVQFAKNWALTGSWYTGKNGFIDEDIFDKMSHQSRMQLIESGVAYRGLEKVTLAISAGIMDEEDSLFGTRGAGAFKTDGAETRFVRVMANYQPTDKFRISGSYTYGMSDANKTSSLMKYSRLTSDSFALAAEYMPDEKHTFGVKMVSPLRVRSGSASFNLPVARDLYEDRIYRETFTADLKPSSREYDLSFFYANEISSDLSWAGETGVRLNPEHQSQEPDYRALFKLNWTW